MARKGEYSPKKDLTGQTFGKLLVLEYAGYNEYSNNRINHKWKCRCECGNDKIAETRALLSGHCKSCGCMSHKPINPNHKHNLSNTPLYNVWKSMKGRCYTKSNSVYSHYGARGITVCDEWKNDFINFYKWAIHNGYDENAIHGECTIDRIDVNGNYEPDNCRIVNMFTQANNKTDSVKRFINGEYLTTREISEKYGIPYKVIKGRIDKGETPEEALQEHLKGKQYTYKGETHNLEEWGKIYNIGYITLYARIYNYKWDFEKALTTPIQEGKGWRKKS